jgi:hypothetical protein
MPNCRSPVHHHCLVGPLFALVTIPAVGLGAAGLVIGQATLTLGASKTAAVSAAGGSPGAELST